MMRVSPILTFLVSLFAFAPISQAQISKPVYQPEVLLIQLSSEHNRMEALKAQGDEEGLKQLDKDLHGVFRAIRNDFRDHFTACPVYYFIDTNLATVKQQRFDGILINAEGNVLNTNPIKGKEFQIAYYGYPKTRMSRTGYLRNEGDKADFDTQAGRAWVVCDKEMNQVSYTRPRTDRGKWADKPEDKKYTYRSRNFDIIYQPSAKQLQSAMWSMGPR